MNNIVQPLSCIDVQGKGGEAEPIFKRSLVLTEQNSGPDHPAVARSLRDLADVLHSQV